jgi:hypothetical protein
MGPVTATISRFRVCGPTPISGVPEFGFSTLRLVNTPEIGDTKYGFMIPACCPQTWEHMGVMAGAVKMLDVGGDVA